MAKKKFNVAEHELVPKHEKISEKEKKELFAQYNLSEKDLPKILVDDPAIQSLKVKEGDIIKISRKSETAGEAVFFRRVSYV